MRCIFVPHRNFRIHGYLFKFFMQKVNPFFNKWKEKKNSGKLYIIEIVAIALVSLPFFHSTRREIERQTDRQTEEQIIKDLPLV